MKHHTHAHTHTDVPYVLILASCHRFIPQSLIAVTNVIPHLAT